MRNLILIASALISVAISLLAVEGVLSFYRSSWDVPPEPASADQIMLYRTLFRFDPVLGHIGVPNVHTPQFMQQQNRYGFRGPDWSARKPAQEFRIGIIGDSQTWGWGLSDMQTISYFLQARGTAPGGKNLRVLNLGIPGYSIDQEFLLFLTLHKKLQLDAVVSVAFLANDLFEVGASSYWGMPRPPSHIEGRQLVVDSVPSAPDNNWARLSLSVPLGEIFGRSPSFGRFLTYQFIGRRSVPLREGLDWCARLIREGYCEMFALPEREQAKRQWFPHALPSTPGAAQPVQLFSAYVSFFIELAEQLHIPYGLVLLPGMKHIPRYDARLVDDVRQALPPLERFVDVGGIVEQNGKTMESFSLDGYHYNPALNLLVAEQIRQAFSLTP